MALWDEIRPETIDYINKVWYRNLLSRQAKSETWWKIEEYMLIKRRDNRWKFIPQKHWASLSKNINIVYNSNICIKRSLIRHARTNVSAGLQNFPDYRTVWDMGLKKSGKKQFPVHFSGFVFSSRFTRKIVNYSLIYLPIILWFPVQINQPSMYAAESSWSCRFSLAVAAKQVSPMSWGWFELKPDRSPSAHTSA